MPYEFATEDQDDSDLAGGRVLYSLPGQTAFPVRLSSEIFQRALSFLKDRTPNPITILDPCCGGATHLTALAFRHWESIGTILAMDIDPEAVSLARRNLGLLSEVGLEKRIAELNDYLQRFGKQSHLDALVSAIRLQECQSSFIQHHAIHTQVFQADSLEPGSLQLFLAGRPVDLVFSDLPYSERSHWQDPNPANPQPPEYRLLDHLQTSLSAKTVVALVTAKHTKINHHAFRRIGQFKIGKRNIFFFQLLGDLDE